MTLSEPTEAVEDSGVVYVVSTPIGNLDDLSPRAVQVLRDVSVIACEDTRHTAKLCQRFDIATRRVSLHAHNEERKLLDLLARVEAGESIAVVSDAGTPLLSDPGRALVAAAHERSLPVRVVPGASAVLAALVVSGFETRPFTFFGFLPRKGRRRREWLDQIARAPGTVVLFEAPLRLKATLGDLHEALGTRRVAVARELTKRYEEVVRGKLGSIELPEPRGECTVVVEGAPDASDDAASAGAIGERIAALLAEGLSPRDVAQRVAEETQRRRSEVYALVLERLDREG